MVSFCEKGERPVDATEAIRARRSIRKYIPGAAVPEAHLRLMLEAAMMAPSACNTRPWDFTVVRDRRTLERIAAAHPYARMAAEASLAVVVGARPDLLPGGMPEYWPQDCAAATENLLLQATALGYGAVWCGVYPQKERMDAIREIVGGSVPFSLVALGVPAEAPPARGRFDPARVRVL
jgi:nitroreductase